MMGWQRPEVFWGMALAAIPVVIHLLRMHRANRVPFPSVRFVRPSHTAAVRLRIPSDWLLLALRIGIVALAVSAVAGPILLTQSRVSAWNAQVARAVVVGARANVVSQRPDERASATSANEAIRSEMQTAAYARRIDVVDLGAGVSRAAAWLESAPPARREIVVVSGFQRGAIDDTVIREIPAGTGIRLVQVGGAVQSAVVQGVELYGVDRIARRAQSIDLTTDTTAVSISEVPGPAQGVRIINPAAPPTARADVDALLKSIAIAGTPAASPHQPIAIQLDDGGNLGTLASIHAGWMLQTVLRLREDLALARLMANSPARDLATPGPWTILVRNGEGKPTIRAASLGDELLIDVAAPPASFVAASAVRAVLAARAGDVEQPRQEIALMSEAQLSAWNRAPAAVDRDVWRNATSNDARWFWGAALVLLAVEQWLRSRSALGSDKETSRAAA